MDMGDDAAATGSSALGRALDEVRSTLSEHADVVADLFGSVSSELRTGFTLAVNSFVGFFHAIDWKVYARTLGLGAGISVLCLCVRGSDFTPSLN
jgi:hypothetical protein